MKASDIVIEPCELSVVRKLIEDIHYSHSVAGVKITQAFRCDYMGEMVGGVIFGQLSTTAWKKYGESEQEVLELRRLVLLDECPRNSESRTVGLCLRWIKKNLPRVRTIVSYADPAYGHSGVIYRASNFRYIGCTATDTGFQDMDTGRTYHSRALRTKYKGDYKPFVKILRGKLADGRLRPISLPGKHIFVYDIKNR